jgi:hypothetical protein
MKPRHISFCSFLFAILSAAAFLLLAPLNAFAETVTFTQTISRQQIDQANLQPPSLKKMRLALDDDGNVMVRYGSVSVTFIYESGNPPQESRMQSSISATRQEVACLGGVSVKFGVAF